MCLVLRGDAAGPLICTVNKGGRPRIGARLGESSIAYVVKGAAKRAAIAHVSPQDRSALRVKAD